MDLIELKERKDISGDIKIMKIYIQFSELIKELKKKELTLLIVESINQDLEALNSISVPNNELMKMVKQKQAKILKLVEVELKVVPKNYYRNLWMVLGISVFGLPIGAAFGLSNGNIGLLAIGLPIGMVIGIGIGSRMDKKAYEEGRQLNIEIKY